VEHRPAGDRLLGLVQRSVAELVAQVDQPVADRQRAGVHEREQNDPDHLVAVDRRHADPHLQPVEQLDTGSVRRADRGADNEVRLRGTAVAHDVRADELGRGPGDQHDLCVQRVGSGYDLVD
jgi:hypothetical protein